MFRLALRDDPRLTDVYRRNVSAVYAFFSYSVDIHTAEDLTAATFERVVRSWRTYDPSRSSVRSWVLAIAHNALMDHGRRQKFRAGPSLDQHPAFAEHLVAADTATEVLDLDAFMGWLRNLSGREREVVGLRYGADLSVEEIARCLDLSVANVYQISSRALRRLRDSAERCEPAAASVPAARHGAAVLHGFVSDPRPVVSSDDKPRASFNSRLDDGYAVVSRHRRGVAAEPKR